MTKQTGLVKQENGLKAIMRSAEINNRFAEVVGNSNAGGYISSVLIAVANNTALQSCDPNSIISSALRAATMRLSVDPSTGQAHIVPFGNKATLIVGWQGIYHMAIRTGKYRFINLITVYEPDEMTEDVMTGNIFLTRHGRKGDKVKGYMLYFQLLSGFSKTIYMTVEECEDHGRKYSKSFNRADGIWQKDPHAMFKKTVMKQGLTKWGYLDPFDMMQMTEAEEQEDFVSGVTIQEAEHHTVAENMKALGFDDEQPSLIEEKSITKEQALYELKKLAATKGLDSRGIEEVLASCGNDPFAAIEKVKVL